MKRIKFLPLALFLIASIISTTACTPQATTAKEMNVTELIKTDNKLGDGAPATAGQEVFQAEDPGQPAGVVAAAAPAPTGGWDAIVSLQLAAAQAGGLHAGRADGAPLQLLPLPYLLLADV